MFTSRSESPKKSGILNYPLLYPRALKIGIKALFALCLVKQHRQKAVAAGAVEALIDRLAEFEKCDAERALATVELLCRIPSGCAAFASHALTVPLLVKIILKISDRATEYAAGALLSLCSAERAQQEAVGGRRVDAVAAAGSAIARKERNVKRNAAEIAAGLVAA
ncbi:UNVERIFIED_CONTAM: U-box domain-containing protein 26 [Sesamum radiatum]|uniref:U-box domain-containing protein 26 n=1 Tax=Sesamum radiatum TaxID=300843 RepID=A0AAW2MTL6_SESRA